MKSQTHSSNGLYQRYMLSLLAFGSSSHIITQTHKS